ncbi:MAG: hypothetical protein R3B94_06335 [Hyphomonas sp.]
MQTQAILKEVANWKLEAKLEDVQRYFFDTTEYEAVKSGGKSFLIGRKGTGKTAVAQSIAKIHDHSVFSEQLSFKNFPFNELYKLVDDRFSQHNRYISVWTFVILNYVVSMMARNEGVAPEGRQIALTIHPQQMARRLERLLPKWVTSTIDLKVLGTGFAGSRTKINPDSPLQERIELLEDIIEQYADSSIYYIIFDELDEDYRDILTNFHSSEYLSLIVGLFKAVQNVKANFTQLKIRPIVVLRDDIYGLLQDNDKNKWSDLKLDIEWPPEKLQRMLAHRISRANGADAPILDFPDAWALIFDKRQVRYGFRQSKRMYAFDFMARSSHLRPRDFIYYLKVCAEREILNGRDIIDPETIRAQDKPFSNYLRDELIDEVGAVLPYINEVFGVLSKINKQSFYADDFITAYNSHVVSGSESRLAAEDVLRLLFHFSVIGNGRRGRSALEFFKYKNSSAELNLEDPILVHRGLYKSLQII